MKSPFLRLLPLFLLAAPLRAQSDKALNFYGALLKRPAAGALFDQFYNAWLDAETVEKMETFLTAEAEKSVEARMILAAFWTRQTNLEKAAQAWQLALRQAPDRAEGWLALAELEARQQRNAEALAAVEKGLQAKPAPALQRRLLECKARTLARTNQREDARVVWERLLKDHPDDEDLRDDFIDLLLQTGDTKAAAAGAAALAEKTADAYRRTLRRARAGDLLANTGDDKAALAAYAKALAETGAGSWLEKDLLRQMEAVYRRRDRIVELSGFLRDLAEKEPQRLLLRRTLARVLQEKAQKSEADKVWRELLAAAPGDRELAEAFIHYLTETQRAPEAAQHWRALIAQHPADAELRLQLAGALRAAKDEAGCETAVRDFLKAAGGTEEASLRAAAELNKFKLSKAALTLLQETVQKFPASEAARLQYASALHGADRKDDARAAWRAEAARPGRLLAAARAAGMHGEHALVWELTGSHLEDFSKDSVALTFYCEAALRAEKWAEGVAAGQRLAALAPDALALGEALTATLRLAERGGLRKSLREKLEARRRELTPAELCLLAELRQMAGDRAGAALILEEVSGNEPALGLALLVRLQVASRDFVSAARTQMRLVDSPGGRKVLHVQRLVELCQEAKFTAEGLRWVAEWKKLAPGNPAPWLREATLLQSAGRTRELLEGLQQASHLWPEDTDVLTRYAQALTAGGRAAMAQQIYLRLFEKAEGTEGKMRWLQPLVDAAVAAKQLDALIMEFQRRHAENRQSAVPLLALAECYERNQDDRRRLGAMQEAARLGEGDPVLMMRAAESAVESGMLEVADSILKEAAALDKTGAALQQRAAVLLRTGRTEEAGQILTQLGADMGAEESAEFGVMLHAAGETRAAAAFLRAVSARFPDNYRLAWLAVYYTRAGDEIETAREWCVRLATTPFSPLPDGAVATLPANALPNSRSSGSARAPRTYAQPAPVCASVLSPVPEGLPGPPAGSDEEMAVILRTMPVPAATLLQNNAAGPPSSPRMPGPVWELRAWAAGEALRLAQQEGPESVEAVKKALLAGGLSAAIFGDAIAAGTPGVKASVVIKPDAAALTGPDGGWLLRFLLGPLPVARRPFGRDPLIYASSWRSAAQDGAELAVTYSAEELRPLALMAWRRFRDTDPVFAVHAALTLTGSAVPEEAEAAGAALTLLEKEPAPGIFLAGAMNAMRLAATAKNPAGTTTETRILTLLESWYRSEPEGPGRDWLRNYLLLSKARGNDPAVYLTLMADEITAGSPNSNGLSLFTEDEAVYQRPRYSGSGMPPGPGAAIVSYNRSYYSQNGGSAAVYKPNTAAGPPPPPAPDPGNSLPLPGAVLLLPPFVMEGEDNPQAPLWDTPLFRTAWRFTPGPWSADREKLRAAIAQCTHPGVRALASLLAGDSTLADRCMQELAAVQPATEENLLTAAAHAWRSRRPAEAVALLEKAAALEPDNAPKAADSAIMAAANLLLWAREPVPDSVKTAALAAMRRRVIHPLDVVFRPAMAGIAEALDALDMAVAIQTAPSSGPGPALSGNNPGIASAGVSPRPHALKGFLRAIQRSGINTARSVRGRNPAAPAKIKEEPPEMEAARAITDARRYLYLAQNARVSLFHQIQNMNYGGGRNVKQREDWSRVREVIKVLRQRAAEAKTAQDLFAIGTALLLHEGMAPPENLEIAVPVLERAMAAAPEDMALRMAVASAAAAAPGDLEDRVPAVLILSADLPPSQRVILLETMASTLSYGSVSSKTFPVTLDLVEALVKTMQAVPAEKRQPSSTDLVRVLAMLREWQPEEEDPNGPPQQQQRPPIEFEAARARRRSLHTALCRELLKTPDTAAAAFESAMSQTVLTGEKWDHRRADALRTLCATKDARNALPVHLWPLPATSSAGVVLEEGVADPAWLRETAVPALRQSGAGEMADALTLLTPLLDCPPEAFSAAAERAAAGLPDKEKTVQFRQATSIAGLRGLERVMAELAAKSLGTGGIHPSLAAAVIKQLHRDGGQAAVDAWVEGLCGPPRSSDIWTRPLKPRATPGPGFTALAELLGYNPGGDGAVINYADPVFAVRLLRALQKPLAALPPDISVPLTSVSGYLEKKRPPAEMLTVLEAAGFLAPLPEFRPVLLTWNQPDALDAPASFIRCARLVRSWVALNDTASSGDLTADNSDKSAGIPANPSAMTLLAQMEKEYGRNFGGRLVAALVRESLPPPADGKKTGPDVLHVIGAELPRLRALPIAQQLEYTGFSFYDTTDPDRESQAALAWLDELKVHVLTQQFERFAAMSDDELLRQKESLPFVLAGICENILPEQPEKVIALLVRVRNLPGGGPAAWGWSVPGIVERAVGQWIPADTEAQLKRLYQWQSPEHLDGGASHVPVQLRRMRAILKMLTMSSPALPPQGKLAEFLDTHFTRWMKGGDGGKESERFILPHSLPGLLERLQTLPADYFTPAQVRMLIPAAMTAARGAVVDAGSGERDLYVKAAEALEKPGGGGALRRLLADGFRMKDLHKRRTDAVEVIRKEQNATHRAAKEKGYYMVDGGYDWPLPGALTAAELEPWQQRLLELITDSTLPEDTRRALLYDESQALARVLDPPLLAAMVALWSGKGAGLDTTRQALALHGLAMAAKQFPPPVTESGRETERLLSEQLRVCSWTVPLPPWAFVVPARSATDDALAEITGSLRKKNGEEMAAAGALRTLVNARRFPAVAQLLSEVPDALFLPPKYAADHSEYYAPDTAAALRDCIATLPAGPERIAVRAVMEAGRDSPALVAAGGIPRRERLESLAKDLVKEDLPLLWQRRLLLLFNEEFPNRDLLKPLLEKTVRDSTVQEIMAGPSSLQALYWRQMETRTAAGEFAPLRNALQQLPAKLDKEWRAVPGKLGDILEKAIVRSGEAWAPPARAEALSLLRTLTAADNSRWLTEERGDREHQRLALCLVMHAVWDALPEYEKAWLALEKNERAAVERDEWAAVHIFKMLGLPPNGEDSMARDPLLPRYITGPPAPVLAKLLAIPCGLPGLKPGMIHGALHAAPKVLDAAPILALAPAFKDRRDQPASAALPDLALLLAEAGRREEARALLPAMGESLTLTPERHSVAAMQMHFMARTQADSPAAALTWLLARGTVLTPVASVKNEEDVVRFHQLVNTVDTALLKSAGPEAWRKEAIARFTAVPLSAPAFFHAACVLEKMAMEESAAGRHEAALALMSLAILTVERVDKFNTRLLDSASRDLFTANYATLALRAGRKLEVVELLPFRSTWQYGPGQDDPFARRLPIPPGSGPAPLGWGGGAKGLATVIKLPETSDGEAFHSSTVGFRAEFTVKDGAALQQCGILFCTLCDVENPVLEFKVDGTQLSESDSGRPEQGPDLRTLTRDPKLAESLVNARTLTLSASVLVSYTRHNLSLEIPVTDPKRPALHFDAALHGVKMTFPQAVEQVKQKRAALEAKAPAYWKELCRWLTE